jgi:hypothetical protein
LKSAKNICSKWEIHAQIQAKKNEPPKENKLMKKMMEMQKQNEERMKKGGKK